MSSLIELTKELLRRPSITPQDAGCQTLISERLLNDGLVAKNRDFLAMAPFLILGVFLLRGVMGFFSNYFISSASRSVIMCLRQDLFAHLQRLPARYYDHTTTTKGIITK